MDETWLTRRQQRASDYFLEHERLTRDLTDDQARPLIEWASQQAAQFAADPSHSDDMVEARLQAIRQAVRQAIQAAPDQPGTVLVALAVQALQQADSAAPDTQP